MTVHIFNNKSHEISVTIILAFFLEASEPEPQTNFYLEPHKNGAALQNWHERFISTFH
jgi:hypothetical protein